MRPKVRTTPDLSETSPAHHEFRHQLAKGEEPVRNWERNVVDRFKPMQDEEVIAELQATSHPFAVCFEQWNSYGIQIGQATRWILP